eukprot:UN29532
MGQQTKLFNQWLCTNKSYIYMVGQSTIKKGEMMSSTMKIEQSKSQGKWFDALCTAMKFYESLSSGAVSRRTPDTQKFLNHQISRLLTEYQDIALCRGSENNFNVLLGVALDYCTTIQNLDLLFKTLYPKFRTFIKEGQNQFLANLEPYVLTGKITVLPPNVLHDFFEYYLKQQNLNANRLQIVEQIILRLEVDKMDIIQITKLCQRYALFTSLC